MDHPQQNSVVERKHQHLLNVAQALFFQSRVPLHFWGECATTTTYLFNRTLSPLLQHNTPYELLYGKPLDYDALRVFGCIAYSSALLPSRHKFTPCVVPCVFVGYPTGYKGYKLYNLTTCTFLVSRDVTFHESNFPFHSISLPHTATDFIIPPDLVLPTPQPDFPDQPPITPTFVRSTKSLSNPPQPPPRWSNRSTRPPAYL